MAGSMIPAQLSPDDQERWLVEHIPHRIRALVPGLPMRGAWRIPQLILRQATDFDRIAFRCWGNSVHEGRLTSMRWLIMFIGIQERNGIAVEATLRLPTDMRIDAISGGALFDTKSPESIILALVWKGCSQATSHPTQDTKHPDVSEGPLAEALHIIISHLEKTIYAASGRNLFNSTITLK